MKNIIKRCTGIILTAALACTALAGCGSKETASKEKPVLRVLMNNIKTDPNGYAVAKMLEEKTGYKVEYDMLPVDNPEEKLNIVLASQEPYDVIIIMGNLRNKFYDYAKQGALMKLDDLIEEYAPNMKEKFRPETWEAMKVDDGYYGVVTANGYQTDDEGNEKPDALASSLLMRTDLAEKCGITKMPETIDEFTEMLRAIKAQDPAGNGDTNVPLTLTPEDEISGLYGAFGLACEWEEIDGKLVNRVQNPRFKDYLTYLNGLYKEGLIDPEYPTNKSNTTLEKFTSGKAAVMPMYYWDAATVEDALDKNVSDYSIDYIQPLSGKNGEYGYGYGASNINRIAVIPKAAEHPEDAMKWMNAKLDTEVFREMAIGVEGEHYNLKDGEYYPILPKFNDERSYANDFITGNDDYNYVDYWLARVRKDDRIYDFYKKLCSDEFLKLAVKNPDADKAILAAQSNEAVLKNLVSDFSLQVIVGAESIDNYDNFIKQWEEEGGKQLTEEINEWYSTVN